MSFNETAFTKENLDLYLRELAKAFRKLNGKTMPAEIILIGGASVLINYGFRDTTYDMDAIILSSSTMRQAINQVGDKFGLPNGWLNTDFMKTSSYSPKLAEHSEYFMSIAGAEDEAERRRKSFSPSATAMFTISEVSSTGRMKR